VYASAMSGKPRAKSCAGEVLAMRLRCKGREGGRTPLVVTVKFRARCS